MNPSFLKVAIVLLVLCTSFRNYSTADEITISGNEHAVSVGDFDFSPCNTESDHGALSVLSQGPNGEMTAGDLWTFFSDRGIDSVENLTICMDWAPDQQFSSDIGVSSLQLRIEDPSQAGGLITDVSLGGDSLIVPGFEVSSFKPEARLGVALGYDFMKRFGPTSTEKIHLDFGEQAQAGFGLPTFSFEGSAGKPDRVPNLFGLIGFVVFWLVVFKCLTMATAPKETSTNPGEIISA